MTTPGTFSAAFAAGDKVPNDGVHDHRQPEEGEDREPDDRRPPTPARAKHEFLGPEDPHHPPMPLGYAKNSGRFEADSQGLRWWSGRSAEPRAFDTARDHGNPETREVPG